MFQEEPLSYDFRAVYSTEVLVYTSHDSISATVSLLTGLLLTAVPRIPVIWSDCGLHHPATTTTHLAWLAAYDNCPNVDVYLLGARTRWRWFGSLARFT